MAGCWIPKPIMTIVKPAPWTALGAFPEGFGDADAAAPRFSQSQGAFANQAH